MPAKVTENCCVEPSLSLECQCNPCLLTKDSVAPSGRALNIHDVTETVRKSYGGVAACQFIASLRSYKASPDKTIMLDTQAQSTNLTSLITAPCPAFLVRYLRLRENAGHCSSPTRLEMCEPFHIFQQK